MLPKGHAVGSTAFMAKARTPKYKCVALHVNPHHPTQPSIHHHSIAFSASPPIRQHHSPNPTRQQENPVPNTIPATSPSKDSSVSALTSPSSPTRKYAKWESPTDNHVYQNRKRLCASLQKELDKTKRILRETRSQLKSKEKIIKELCDLPSGLSSSQIRATVKAIQETANNGFSGDSNGDEKEEQSPLQLAYEIYRCRYPRRRTKRFAHDLMKDVVSVMSSETKHAELVQFRNVMRHEVSKYYGKQILTSRKILRLLDVEGGGFLFSFHAINLLRQLDIRSTGQKKSSSSFPSRSSLSRFQQKMNCLSQSLFPIKFMDDREGFTVDLSTLFPPLLLIFGLLEKARRGERVEIVLSGDGAQLTNRTAAGHVTVFIKIVDRDAVNPITGECLLFHEDGGEAQSRDFVFPIFCMIGKDDDQNMLNFVRPVYDQLQRVCAEFPMNSDVSPIEGGPFLIRYGADMKWLWACVRCGGGCKSRTMFCCYCPALKDNAWIAREDRCSSCADNEERVNKPCYHTERCIEGVAELLENEKTNMQEELGPDCDEEFLEKARRKSRICLPTPQQADGGRTDKYCVDFDYTDSPFEVRVAFGDRVTAELRKRGLSRNGGLRDKVRELWFNM